MQALEWLGISRVGVINILFELSKGFSINNIVNEK